MRKFQFVTLLVMTILFFHACYTMEYQVGTIDPGQPLFQVAEKKNHFLIGGLVPLTDTQRVRDFIGDKKDYVIKTERTFMDGLLLFLTHGIYTPFTTKYYIPYDPSKSSDPSPSR